MNYEKVMQAISDLDEEIVLEAMEKIVANQGEGAQEAMKACQDGMAEVGKRFEEGEYFVGDLIFAGEIMTSAMDILKPVLQGEGGNCGRMILCTVKDDLHDIGKNIVKAMLEASGFEVLDLGIDVAPATIVETAQKEDIKIIALSGVLTLALDSMKNTVEALKTAGLRDGVKVIIGGNPVTPEACEAIGADEWAFSPQKTVDTCRKWAQA